MFRTSGADFQAHAVIVNGTNGKESIRVGARGAAGDDFANVAHGATAQARWHWCLTQPITSSTGRTPNPSWQP